MGIQLLNSSGCGFNMSHIKLKEGYWYNDNVKPTISICQENHFSPISYFTLDYPDLLNKTELPKWEIGDFGTAREEVKKASGSDIYNLQMNTGLMGKMHGVVNEAGDKIFMWFGNTLQVTYWVSEEEHQKKMDDRDPMEAPSCQQYTPKPGSPGRVYWLSGPPGSGKSTTCQMMARKKDFRYFEADATMSLVNPFTDISTDNPTMATYQNKPLKGYSREDVNTVLYFHSKMKVFNGDGDCFDANIRPVLKIMAQDILRQKERLGGDFAVAQTVFSRESRQLLLEKMGPELVFIVINLTKETQAKRINSRHPGEELKVARDNLQKMYDAYEPA